MTVNNTTPIVSYAGNGVTVNFDFGFQVFTTSYLTVSLSETDADPANVVILQEGVDYTVALDVAFDDQGQPINSIDNRNPVAGTITTTVAPPTGYDLILQRTTPLGQSVSYQRTGPFPAKTHERALDQLSMQIMDLSALGSSGEGGGGEVDSVFGRQGDVFATVNDYSASFIANDSNVSGVHVSDALNNLAGDIAAGPGADSVTNAMLANQAGYSIKANISGSAVNPVDAGVNSSSGRTEIPTYAGVDGNDWIIGFRAAGDGGALVKFNYSTIYGQIPNDTITTAMIQNDAITEAKISDQAISTAKIALLAVDTAQLANDAVESSKIADNAIGNEHLQDNSVNTNEIVDGAVDTAQLADDSVTGGTLGAGVKLKQNTVDKTNMAADSIDTVSIVDAAVTAAKLAADLPGSVLADNSIENRHLTDNAVDTAELTALSVTTAKIANDAVDTLQIATNAVTANEIAGDAVNTSELVNNAVTTAKILDSNVTEAKINNGAVTADKLASNAVTTNKIADKSVSNQKLGNATAYSLKGNPTVSGTVSPTDVQRSTFASAATPAAGDWAIGWNAAGQMVTYDVSTFVGDAGLDPDVAETINARWKFGDGLESNGIYGFDPSGLGYTLTGLKANAIVLNAIDETNPNGGSAIVIKHEDLKESYDDNPAAPALSHAGLVLGPINSDGEAEIKFNPTVPSYEQEDTDSTAGSTAATADPGWTTIPNISLTLGQDLNPGSSIIVEFDAEATTREDVIRVELVRNGSEFFAFGTINVLPGIRENFALSDTAVVLQPSGATYTVRVNHSVTTAGNQALVYADATTPFKLSVYEPASGGAGEANVGANVGSGAGQVYRGKTATTLDFKTLRSSDASVVITNEADTIDLVATGAGGGEANSAANLGAGEGVFAQKNGLNIELKSLKATAPLAVAASTTEITFSLDQSNIATLSGNNVFTGANTFDEALAVGTPIAGGDAVNITYFEANKGETNQGASLGGTAIYTGKSGAVMQFRGVVGGDNISLSSDVNSVTFNWAKPANIPESDQSESITGAWTFGQITVTSAPSSANHVVRKTELDTKVTGPGSAASDNVVSFNGATGKLVQDSGVAVSSIITSLDSVIKVPTVTPVTNNRVAVFDGTTGDLLKDSGKLTSDFLESSDLATYVQGPASAIDTNIAVFDGATGKLLADSSTKISDLATTATLGNYLPLAGGTLTGHLALPASTPSTSQAVRRDYMETRIGELAGDMSGPGVSGNNRIAVFDGTSGKLVKDSGVVYTDLATTAYVNSQVATRVPESSDTGSGKTGFEMAVLTQAEYDGLSPDANTLYFISG